MAVSPAPSSLHIVALIPIRNDWASVSELLRRLDGALASHSHAVEVLLIDDCSNRRASREDFPSHFAALRRIQILRLRRNVGHQRGIATGLAHIATEIPCDAVLVMDGDGEDTPEGALQLIHAFPGDEAVFARRSRRTESIVFRVLYQAYKAMHRLLTGVRVEVGNFSILPSSYLSTLAVMSELWNHYAAAVIRSGLALTKVPIPRGHRIAGKSQMNFVSLTAHGINALSVYGDIVGVRLLIASAAGAMAALFGIATVIWIRVFTGDAIPGWATYAVGALAILFLQFLTIASSFAFTFLPNRINLNFVPMRDCGVLVDGVQEIYREG